MTGDEIKDWRERRRLSQAKLAELLPVSIRTIQGWEQSQHPAPTFIAAALVGVEVQLALSHPRTAAGTMLVEGREAPEGAT